MSGFVKEGWNALENKEGNHLASTYKIDLKDFQPGLISGKVTLIHEGSADTVIALHLGSEEFSSEVSQLLKDSKAKGNSKYFEKAHINKELQLQ